MVNAIKVQRLEDLDTHMVCLDQRSIYLDGKVMADHSSYNSGRWYEIKDLSRLKVAENVQVRPARYVFKEGVEVTPEWRKEELERLSQLAYDHNEDEEIVVIDQEAHRLYKELKAATWKPAESEIVLVDPVFDVVVGRYHTSVPYLTNCLAEGDIASATLWCLNKAELFIEETHAVFRELGVERIDGKEWSNDQTAGKCAYQIPIGGTKHFKWVRMCGKTIFLNWPPAEDIENERNHYFVGTEANCVKEIHRLRTLIHDKVRLEYKLNWSGGLVSALSAQKIVETLRYNIGQLSKVRTTSKSQVSPHSIQTSLQKLLTSLEEEMKK